MVAGMPAVPSSRVARAPRVLASAVDGEQRCVAVEAPALGAETDVKAEATMPCKAEYSEGDAEGG